VKRRSEDTRHDARVDERTQEDRERVKRKADPRAEAPVLQFVLEVHRRLELRDQVASLAAQVGEIGDAERSWAFALDEDPGSLILVTEDAADVARWEAWKIDRQAVERHLGDEVAAEIAGLPEFLEVFEELKSEAPERSWMLGVRGTEAGLVGLIVVPGEQVSGDARERVLALLEAVRPAIANGVQVRSIRELIIKDDTVECFNRRYFDEFLVEELARASRFRSPVSLIFFDMDNLKEVNSRHGHAIGSQTLMEVARRVRIKIRKFDKLFRFGGDEFCIVLPETEWHGALEVAERVRESIAGRPLLADRLEGKGLKMTASFGIASFPLHSRTKEELIMRADRAMQRIKTGSKNSIGIAEIAKADPS
jgi:diguanylate cyclase (GGDEF)-like protein